MRQKRNRKIFGAGCVWLIEDHQFFILSACGHIQVVTNKETILLIIFMISSKLVPIFSENSRFCDFLSCVVNVESLKNEISHELSAFFVSGQFS